MSCKLVALAAFPAAQLFAKLAIMLTLVFFCVSRSLGFMIKDAASRRPTCFDRRKFDVEGEFSSCCAYIVSYSGG
jgi:hypothetical protein